MSSIDRSYLILTTPRSGSWLLAEALRATGVAGRPEEYFWTELRHLYVRDWRLQEPVSDHALLQRILAAGTTANGVFGAKVHWMQFGECIQMLRAATGDRESHAAELLRNVFPGLSVVRLQRLDRVGQAISWYRALATDNWWHVEGAHDTREAPGLSLDADYVAALENRLARENAAIDQFLTSAGLPVTPLTYEALVDDYEGSVRAVLAGLDVQSPDPIPPTRLTRQADALNDRWRVEYEQRMKDRQRSGQPSAASPLRRSIGTSIVIVSHNEGDNLRATVARMAATTPRHTELIVVDDHSTDGSTSRLADLAPDVTLLRPATRLGIAGARNFGARAAQGEVVVFSDAHVDPRPGWLPPLRRALEDPDVGQVAPAVRDLHRSDFAGYGFTWVDAGMSVSWLRARPAGPSEVPFICGCFSAMRRRDFETLGGFDRGLSTWGSEDAELSLHVWRTGLRCLVIPEAEVGHLFRSSFSYAVEWTAVIHNALRVAAVHFGRVALGRVLTHWSRHPAFPTAYARLDLSDIGRRRKEVTTGSRHDDRWFIGRFAIEALA